MRIYFSAGIAALTLLLNGCSGLAPWNSAPERSVPEADATYWCREELHGPVIRLREWADAVHQDIQRSQLTDQEKRNFNILLATAQLLIRQAGLSENTVYTASGKEISIRSLNCWRTRRTLSFGGDAEHAMLYRMLGKGRFELQESLSKLPADTLLAVEIDLDTEALADVLIPALEGLAGGKAEGPEKLLKALSGRWKLEVAPGVNGIAFTLSVPDRRQELWHFLTREFPFSGKSRTIRLPEIREMPAVRITSQKERLVLRGGHRAPTREPMLSELLPMRKMLETFPVRNGGYIFIDSDFWLLLARIRGRSAVPLPQMPRVIAVLNSTPEALQLDAVSTWDPVSESLLLPFMLFGEERTLEFLRAGERIRETSMRHNEQQGCDAHLQELGKRLADFAGRHQGKFPAGSDIAGFRELLKDQNCSPELFLCPAACGDAPAKTPETFDYDHCSYVYIGGSDKSTPADFPLAFDWPLNHRNNFHVLFVSGKTAGFSMENLDSCRKIASYLQSRFRYPEKDFERLRETADKLDAQFLKGHSR